MRCLQRGGVVAIPTESSYGLSADPHNHTAVNTVFRIKGRPADKPLPVVVESVDALDSLGVELTSDLESTLRLLWPAPLTVVLPIRQPLAATAGQTTLAVRVPQHDPLRDLLSELKMGLTATSANPSGEEAIREPRALPVLLGAEDSVIVDGGVLSGGEPSTLVRPEPNGWSVLRQGAFPAERLPGGALWGAT